MDFIFLDFIDNLLKISTIEFQNYRVDTQQNYSVLRYTKELDYVR